MARLQRRSLCPLVLALAGCSKEAAPSVESLTARLKGSDSGAQARAVYELEMLGPAAAPATPTLVALLRTGANTRLVGYSQEILARIGPAAIPALSALLRDEDESVRERAIGTLRAAGPASADALPQIRQLMWTGGDRGYALIPVLTEMGPRALPLAIHLLSGPRRIAYGLKPVFWNMGKAAVPGLIPLLASEDRTIRERAAFALSAVGTNAIAAAEAVAAALRNERFGNRCDLLGVVIAIGPAAKAAAPTLAELLDRPGDLPRPLVISALGALGSAGRTAETELLHLLERGDSEERAAAGVALWRIENDAAATLRAWEEILANGSEDDVRAVVRSASELGPAAAPLAPHIAARLGSEDPQVAIPAEKALAAIGEPAIPPLVALARPPGAICLKALDTLGEIGPGSAKALPVLVELLASDDTEVRCHVLRAIASIGPDAASALPSVLPLLREDETALPAATVLVHVPAVGDPPLAEIDRLLQSEDVGLMQSGLCATGALGARGAPLVHRICDGPGLYYPEGIVALGRIGPAAAPAVDSIRQFARDPRASFRMTAAVALWRITGKEDELEPLLRELASPIATWRIFAASGCGDVSPAPSCVTEALLHALSDGDWRVREAAARALGAIHARSAAGALRQRQLDGDEDERVRRAAETALMSLS